MPAAPGGKDPLSQGYSEEQAREEHDSKAAGPWRKGKRDSVDLWRLAVNTQGYHDAATIRFVRSE